MEPLTGCETVRTVSTLWLDRRLSESARQRVDDHLRKCSDCRGEYRELLRLSKATRALPRAAPKPGAAFRALATAAAPAAHARWRPWLAAAAGLVVLLSLAAAYRIGIERGRREERTNAAIASIPAAMAAPVSVPAPVASARDAAPIAAPVVEPVVAPSAAPPPAGSTRYARAACGLLADLAAIEEVEPELRVPLLGSQLRAFDLPAWVARAGVADEPGHELITLMRDLDAALASRDTAKLLALARELADVEPLLAAPAPLPRGQLEVPRFTRTDAFAALDDFSELTTLSCVSLAELLQAKAAWVDGDYDRALESARRDAARLQAGPLRASYRTLFVVSAGETGDQELASRLLAGFGGGFEEPLSAFLRGMKWTRADGGFFSLELSVGGLHLHGGGAQDAKAPPPKQKPPPQQPRKPVDGRKD